MSDWWCSKCGERTSMIGHKECPPPRMSVRGYILEALDFAQRGEPLIAEYKLRGAIRALDASPETTQEIVTHKPGRVYIPESGSIMDAFHVVEKKSRIIVDD